MGWIQVKADVETQGDFVQSLATEVRAASFTNIEDLVAFVNWLDEELSFLVGNDKYFPLNYAFSSVKIICGLNSLFIMEEQY